MLKEGRSELTLMRSSTRVTRIGGGSVRQAIGLGHYRMLSILSAVPGKRSCEKSSTPRVASKRAVRQEDGALPGGKNPVCAAGTGTNEPFLRRYLTMTSTRRFLARPAGVSLLATGLLSPWPAANKLLLAPPSLSACTALLARASESS